MGTFLDAAVSTVDTVVDGIQTDLSNGTDGLGALKTAIDAIPTSNPTAAAIADAVWTEDIGDHSGTSGSTAEALDGASAPTAAAVADAVWDEAQADHVSAGSFGLIASEIATIDTVVDGIQTDLDNGTDGLGALKSLIDTIDTNVDSVLVDTGTTLPATLATIDNNVDAILVDTDTTIPGLLSTIDTVVDGIQTDLDNGTDGLGAIKTAIDAVTTNIDGLQGATVTKNAAYSDFEFPMRLTSDHYTAATGKTVAGERSLDGGSFSSVSGTITEVSDGVYQFDALAADTNGDSVTWKFSATDCDDTIVHFKTST
jgi:hypothetical protein